MTNDEVVNAIRTLAKAILPIVQAQEERLVAAVDQQKSGDVSLGLGQEAATLRFAAQPTAELVAYHLLAEQIRSLSELPSE